MIKEAIGIGDTELQAQEDACRQLGVETYEAEFEIIQRAEKKVFGLFGACKAKVRAFIKTSPADTAVDFLKKVLVAMGLEGVTLDVKETDENGVTIDLAGEDVGFVIGRRGETLDALQHLAQLYINKECDQYYRVVADTEKYREKREEALKNLAQGLAKKVMRTRKEIALEPMKAYERRIIHTALQGYSRI